MSIWLVIILFVIGIVLIVKGGDYFVDASVWIAEVLSIPKFLVGATIVSFATTLPELLVSVFAAIDRMPDMAAGNAIGSVTANVGLIMSISIIAIPAVIKRNQIALKGSIMLVVAIILMLFARDGAVSMAEAIVLIAVFVIYMTENIISAKKTVGTDAEKVRPEKKEIITNLLKFVIGIAGIVVGADLLVDNGSELARFLGVPEGIIAVTLVAIGTSLPELVTTLTAVFKKQASLSIGNIVGANIIDLTLIMPICSLIYHGSIPVSAQTAGLDLPVCTLVCAIAVIPTIVKERFKRWQGILLAAVYLCYVAVLCTTI